MNQWMNDKVRHSTLYLMIFSQLKFNTCWQDISDTVVGDNLVHKICLNIVKSTKVTKLGKDSSQ